MSLLDSSRRSVTDESCDRHYDHHSAGCSMVAWDRCSPRSVPFYGPGGKLPQ